MDETMSEFDKNIAEANYLAAYAFAQSQGRDKQAQAANIGKLAQALVKQLSADRAKDDKEQLMFHRSLLSYVLRDFPGLASLYREQIRSVGPGLVPESMQDLWRDFNDIISGRKSLDEELRQRFDEVKHRAQEAGFKPENVLRGAEEGLRQGFEGLKNLFNSVFGVPQAPSQPSPNANPSDDDSSQTDNYKVRVENADDPLPGAIHTAQKVDAVKEDGGKSSKKS